MEEGAHELGLGSQSYDVAMGRRHLISDALFCGRDAPPVGGNVV